MVQNESKNGAKNGDEPSTINYTCQQLTIKDCRLGRFLKGGGEECIICLQHYQLSSDR
jgi:hypothetical protein